MFFNNLPYRESNFKLKIAPGSSDSLKFQFTYPDFIFINGIGAVYNGPGGRLTCYVKSLKVQAIKMAFTGNNALENDYYQAYFNYLGNPDQEGRPYYTIGDKLKDFNKFPAIADSLTQIRLRFLQDYQDALPTWFKQHEYRRLTYNGMMRKYNVLASKLFYGDKPIPVNEQSYYSFEQDLKLADPEMIVNTEYLWAADFYLFRLSGKLKKAVPDAMIYLIDSLCKDKDMADLLKMRRLSKIYTLSKTKYDSVYTVTNFHNPANKTIIDSLIQTKLGFPKIGNKAPGFALKDINGKAVSLSDYTGQTIIINFWAIWCGPCIAEFPAENKLFQQNKGKGLTIINVCIDSDTERWQAISKRDNLQMINLFADAAVYQSIKTKYNIGSLPRSILITKDFKVADSYFKRASTLTDKDVLRLLQ